MADSPLPDKPDSDTSLNLHDAFWTVLLHYNQICRLEAYRFQLVSTKPRAKKSAAEAWDTSSVISKIQSLIEKVETLDVFGRNDTLDDIPSGSLKFLLLPFILGQYLEYNQDLNVRRDYLLRAKKFYGLFCVTTLSLLHDSDSEYSNLLRIWDNYNDKTDDEAQNSIDPNIRRQQTIRRRHQIAAYSNLIIDEGGLRYPPLDDVSERTCYVALLKESLLESVICCELIDREVEFLKQRAQNATESHNINESAEPVDLDSRLDGVGKILQKPFIVKIANQAELRRFFNSRVFQPSHILPSISLKEAAEHDMRVELGLQEAQKRTLVCAEEDEDTRELKQRAWDDWKDENPKGSGNKMTNRG